MASWREFEAANPAMAASGRELLHQFGVPLGYLATVRRDGGPRVHPFCPIIHASRVFGLIGTSPKQRDLLRDGRYAVHSFPAPDRDDEFYFTGRAAHRADTGLIQQVREALTSTGATSDGHEALFELDIERALLSRYKKRGEPDNWPPRYEKWVDPRETRKMAGHTLYERLGGYDAISAVAEDLLGRLKADPRLARFWQHRGEDGVRREKQLLVDFLCSSAGGPLYYTGRDMKTSHRGMGVDEGDWSAFLGHLDATLDAFGVPKAEHDEVVAFVQSTKPDIVEA